MTEILASSSTIKGGSPRVPPLLFAPYRLPAKRYSAPFERGESMACPSLVMRYVPNGLEKSCLGVITAKKTFHLAVNRNRARRLMREAFRLERPRLVPGYDLILIGRRKLTTQTCGEVRRDFLWLCRKAKLMRNEVEGA
ncbi:MAG: ribonuclease P protein component [Kiritimatiellia bacterium]